ncbi:hypothetical protein RB195_004240 [Necator americanus]|uniref:F-box domain protein n=1 Tax=Necator americanus TaxID=51031 RepID=A0ABR1BL64_NECAM
MSTLFGMREGPPNPRHGVGYKEPERVKSDVINPIKRLIRPTKKVLRFPFRFAELPDLVDLKVFRWLGADRQLMEAAISCSLWNSDEQMGSVRALADEKVRQRYSKDDMLRRR